MFQYPLFRIELLSGPKGEAQDAIGTFQYPLFRIELLSYFGKIFLKARLVVSISALSDRIAQLCP